MRRVRQFTFRIRQDLLTQITSVLWERGINISAFSADVMRREGVLRLVVDDVPLARKTFAEHSWNAKEEDVIVLNLPNKPGSLALLSAKLAKEGIKVNYVYTGPGKTSKDTDAYLGVSDLQRALKALR